MHEHIMQYLQFSPNKRNAMNGSSTIKLLLFRVTTGWGADTSEISVVENSASNWIRTIVAGLSFVIPLVALSSRAEPSRVASPAQVQHLQGAEVSDELVKLAQVAK